MSLTMKHHLYSLCMDYLLFKPPLHPFCLTDHLSFQSSLLCFVLEDQTINMSSSSSTTTTTRWCPTPEQLMILEEIYRRGMTTPKATQVQQITAYLSYYGKVEGKNVFYWFQNHKARERQKLRKKLMMREQQQQQQQLQVLMQQNHHDHVQFVHHFDHCSVLMTDGCPHYNSSQVLPHQGGPQPASTNMTWRAEESDKERPMKIYGSDPMYPTDVDTPFSPPCCTRKPLKTLELFPTKSMAPPLNTSSHASLSDYK